MDRDCILLLAFLTVLICHSTTVTRILADTMIFEDPPSSSSGQDSGSQLSSRDFSEPSSSRNWGTFSQASGSQVQSGGNRFAGQSLNAQSSGGKLGESQATGSQFSFGTGRISDQSLAVQSSGRDEFSQAMGSQHNFGNAEPSQQARPHSSFGFSNFPGQSVGSDNQYKFKEEKKDVGRHKFQRPGSENQLYSKYPAGSKDWSWNGGIGSIPKEQQFPKGTSSEASGSQFQFGSGTSGQVMAAQSSSKPSGTFNQASGSQVQFGDGFSGQSLNAQSSSGQTGGISQANGIQFTSGSGKFSSQSLHAQSSSGQNGGLSQADGSQFSSGSNGLFGQSLNANTGGSGSPAGEQSQTSFALALSLMFSQLSNKYGVSNRGLASQQKADDTFEKAEESLTEAGSSLGEVCFQRLLCEVGANPSFYGDFSWVCQSFFSNLDDDYPLEFAVYVNAYSTGKKNRDVIFCQKKFLKCPLSSTDLRDAVNIADSNF